MKRSRLIKCLTVTKANFRIRTTCYLFFIVFCSVFFSLSFSCCRCCFFFTSCSVDCVYVLWTSLFSVCASNTIDTAGFHTFFCLIFQNRMHAVRTENIFRVKIWICFRLVRFFFFSSFVLRFSFWLLRLIQFQSGYVRIEEKKRMHKIIRIALVLYLRLRFFINAAPHLTTVLSMHFSAVWCWSIVGRTVQQINESLNEKWMYKSKM